MRPFVQVALENWQYVVGGISFATTVLALFALWQGLKKGRIDIRKLRLETEAKEEEKRTRITLAKNNDELIKFEYIRHDAENPDWRQVNISDFTRSKNYRITKAKNVLGEFDLSQLSYFEIKHSLENSCPSFEIVVLNLTQHPVSLLEIGARFVYLAHVDMELPYGGAPESAYELPLTKTFIIDVSSLMGGFGAYVTEYIVHSPLTTGPQGLGAAFLSEYDLDPLFPPGGEPTWAEWKCNTVLRSDRFAPYIINPEGRFRYRMIFKRWPLFTSAILQMSIMTSSGERLSNPLYVRYGNDWLEERE